MTAGRVVFLFPGQGSQAVGMGRLMADAFSCARDTFREADEALGFPLSTLCFEGPEEKLRLTELTQPALLATSLACERALRFKGIVPAFVAGHSLGEYSALVSAGALRFAEALRLVSRRGRFMQEAVPVGQGGMAAILGLPAAEVEQLCREEAGGETLSAANYNSPDQTVIAGSAAAVARAVKAAPGRGAKRAVPLPVSAPFHCPLMAPAKEALRPHLEAAEFRDLECPLVSNVDARPGTSGAAARSNLIDQITAPVRWEGCMRTLAENGATTYVEVGPGRVLTSLARRILPEARTASVEDPASLEKTVTLLEQTA